MIFHRVVTQWDPLRPSEPDAQQFLAKMRQVTGWFNVLPLDEAVARLQSGTLPSRPLAITFDDGYADNCTVAGPILKELGIPATCFVATGYLDGGRMFNDIVIESVRQAAEPLLDASALGLGYLPIATNPEKLVAISTILGIVKRLPPRERAAKAEELAQGVGAKVPRNLMLTSSQVRGLPQFGFSVGAHTVTHPVLASVPDAKAWEEIAGGKEHLEALCGKPVTLFAYPNGRPNHDYGAQHVAMVKRAGFCAGFSTAKGVAGAGSDPYQLPRFTPWDREPWKFGLRFLENLTQIECEHVRPGPEDAGLSSVH